MECGVSLVASNGRASPGIKDGLRWKWTLLKPVGAYTMEVRQESIWLSSAYLYAALLSLVHIPLIAFFDIVTLRYYTDIHGASS